MATTRQRLLIRGAVQGVGFRPTVARIAQALGLMGYVTNSSQGVTIEVEGEADVVSSFLPRFLREKPPRAVIQGTEQLALDPIGFSDFQIRESDAGGEKGTLILPDLSICDDCIADISDPQNRRYRYPFTNCTNCGPRFTILESLPYDRDRTTMRGFEMCEACATEYQDSTDRRFHAQPNACPRCGPHLELWGGDGSVLARGDEALRLAETAIREGRVVAVKGLGGFHLMVDATQEEAVKRLRVRKCRDEKPFAVMMANLAMVRAHCELSRCEEVTLCSPEAPIVLLKKSGTMLPSNIAPRNPLLGGMLPYTPLHHLLLSDLARPVVATSGNRTDEPICTNEVEALQTLKDIADLFLIHNRPIARYVDDSIVREVGGRPMVLRRARGYAPLPLIRQSRPIPLLALGAHLKNTIAFSAASNVFVGAHVGDLDTPAALSAFRWTRSALPALYEVKPEAVACDLHPDYVSSQEARLLEVPVVSVQHHHAHVLSCMADNELDGPVLGISWDGTGLGTDRTIWGGEFLRVDGAKMDRAFHLRTFPLPGGDLAARQPWRSALGVLFELFGREAFDHEMWMDRLGVSPSERPNLAKVLEQGINCPRTSSAGRLFDAVSALTGLRRQCSFEGQGAMELEFALPARRNLKSYDFELKEGVLNWEGMFRSILAEVENGETTANVAARFHNTLVEMMVAVAKNVGEKRIVLTGGCFQNRYLSERAIERLSEEGFAAYWHQRIPPNDGGISLGQMLVAWYIRSGKAVR